MAVMPVIQLLQRLRQEDYKFKASMGNTMRSCLKKKLNKIKIK
jgi:hypothetical protein